MAQQQASSPPLNTALLAVTTGAIEELSPVWALNPTKIAPTLFQMIPALVDKWGLASASAAATWYDELRDTQNIAGRFTAIVDPLEDPGAHALAGWGAEPLNLDQPDLEQAKYRVEGGLQKRIVNAANHTITNSADQDPHARGYMRRTRPGACKFCIMVASRGAVYTKTSATFACHEHCYCEAIPAWGGRALPVGPYKPSDKPSTPADRARVRKWIADNL